MLFHKLHKYSGKPHGSYEKRILIAIQAASSYCRNSPKSHAWEVPASEVKPVETGSGGQALNQGIILQKQHSDGQLASNLVLCHFYSKFGDRRWNHIREGRASGLGSKQSPGQKQQGTAPPGQTRFSRYSIVSLQEHLSVHVLLVSFPIRKMGMFPMHAWQWLQELIST